MDLFLAQLIFLRCGVPIHYGLREEGMTKWTLMVMQ